MINSPSFFLLSYELKHKCTCIPLRTGDTCTAGDDGSDEYNALASVGAFFDATTEHIFEEEGKGMLASL